MKLKSIGGIFFKLFGSYKQSAVVFKREAEEEFDIRLEYLLKRSVVDNLPIVDLGEHTCRLKLNEETILKINRESWELFQSCFRKRYDTRSSISAAIKLSVEILRSAPERRNGDCSELIDNFYSELETSSAELPLRTIKKYLKANTA